MTRAERRRRKRDRKMADAQQAESGSSKHCPSVAGGSVTQPVADRPAMDHGGSGGGELRRSEMQVLERAVRRNTFNLTSRSYIDVPAKLEKIALTSKSRRTAIASSRVLVQMAHHNHREETAGLLPGEHRPDQPQTVVNVQGDVNVQQNNESPAMTDEEREASLRRLFGEYGRNGDSR